MEDSRTRKLAKLVVNYCAEKWQAENLTENNKNNIVY